MKYIFCLWLVCLPCWADTHLCSGHFANPLTDVCWRCLFPITIGDACVLKGEQPDTPNPSSPVCACPSETVGLRVGISTGYWEPMALVDVTRHPYW